MTTSELRKLASAMSPAHRAAVLAQMQPDAPKVRRGMNKTEAAGIVVVSIPIRTVSELNRRDHWAVVAARAKRQRTTTAIFVSRVPRLQMPLSVLMVRTGGKRMDKEDNLAAAMKHVRDGVADAYGVDDGSPLWEWRCGQEPGKGPLGVRVEIKEKP